MLARSAAPLVSGAEISRFSTPSQKVSQRPRFTRAGWCFFCLEDGQSNSGVEPWVRDPWVRRSSRRAPCRDSRRPFSGFGTPLPKRPPAERFDGVWMPFAPHLAQEPFRAASHHDSRGNLKTTPAWLSPAAKKRPGKSAPTRYPKRGFSSCRHGEIQK